MNYQEDNYYPEYDPEARDAGGYHDDGYDEDDDFFTDAEIRDQETGFCSQQKRRSKYRR